MKRFINKRSTKEESKTSWGKHAKWYGGVVEEKGSYQKEVILPNLLQMLDLKRGEDVLDLACGEGLFAREFYKTGANVAAVDIAPELIADAKRKSPPGIAYQVADAKDLSLINSAVFDAVAIVLAIQNIDDMDTVFRGVKRILKPGGRFVMVMNHPVLRIPKLSGWGWDEGQLLQYRRVNGYMSELKIPIQMHPGDRPEDITWSFHRPLQSYFLSLHAAGFMVDNLEEWTSNKKSQVGPRAKAEDRARNEIPMFLAIKATTGR